MRVEPGARRSAVRSAHWLFVSLETIRGGVINGIVGELKGLGMAVSATTVRSWRRAAGLGPVGTRGGMTWREFVRAHRRSMLAAVFFTVETMCLQRLYVLFFIELGSRRVHVAGCTLNPIAPWVAQQACAWRIADFLSIFEFAMDRCSGMRRARRPRRSLAICISPSTRSANGAADLSRGDWTDCSTSLVPVSRERMPMPM
jgi:hypothetical protein